MRKWIGLIVGALLMVASVSQGALTVTKKGGSPASSITLTGTGFGAGPGWLYYEGFEPAADVTGIDSTYAGNPAITTRYSATADSAYTRAWMAQRFGSGYRWQITTGTVRDGDRSMNANMLYGRSGTGDFTVDDYFYLGGLNENLRKSAQDELFVSAHYYDAADTTGVDTLSTAGRELVKIVGATSASDVMLGKITRAAWPDSSQAFREAYGATPTYVSRALKGWLYKRWTLLCNKWNRVDAWLKAESSASASDGRMFVYQNSALVDSARNRDFGATTTPWTGIRFNSMWLAADSLANARTYWDNIYIADVARRVELGDKITYGKCTVKYVQPPTYWSSDGDSITFTPVMGSLEDSAKVYVFVIGTANAGTGGAIASSAMTAVDSLVMTPPSISVASDSLAFLPDGAYSLAFDNDSDDGDLLGYLAVASYTINWGDGKTSVVTASPATHMYQREGHYRASITATNWAGTGTTYVTIKAYSAPGRAGGTMFKAFDLYDNAYPLGWTATSAELCALTKEITISFWNTAGDQVWPLSQLLTESDSVETVIRGTCRTFEIPEGFDRVYIKTFPVGSDSTGVKTAWSMNWR